MQTNIIVFPFDLFGSAGAGAGARLLADELTEVLADNARESVPTRAQAYNEHVRIDEFEFATLEAYQSWREDGRKAVRSVIRRGDFLVWLAGNHLGSLPVYDELTDEKSLVVQFDAHLDIHHFDDCTPELSHGNFLLHRKQRRAPVFNLGHRELLLTPDYLAEHFHHAFGVADLTRDEEPARKALLQACDTAERIFIDIDCDVFDPRDFSAINEPVPFGLSPREVLRWIELLWSPKVAGILLSEFDPARDHDDRSLATLMWLVEYLLIRRYE